jgi:hypothetical protein
VSGIKGGGVTPLVMWLRRPERGTRQAGSIEGARVSAPH